MIIFRIDRRAGIPAYLQIVEQVEQAVLLGRLTIGEKLPTAREVVGMTTINPNTVLKAYRELEHRGLVEGRVGSGTYVTSAPEQRTIDASAALGAELAEYVTKARDSGVPRHEIEALFKAAADDVFAGDVAGDLPSATGRERP